MPSNSSSMANNEEKIKEFIHMYEHDLPNPITIDVELYQWKRKFEHMNRSDLPNSPLSALNSCDSRIFPNLSTLFKILCTVPVTSCEAERSSLHYVD